MASTSVEMLSNSASVVNSVTFPYAERNGTAGFLSEMFDTAELERLSRVMSATYLIPM